MMIDYWSWFYWEHCVVNYVKYFRGEQTLIEAMFSHFTCMWLFWYVVTLPIMIVTTAILTHHERSVIADIQFRKGPRKIGTGGLLQPISDAIKLLVKEHIRVRFAEKEPFYLTSWLSFGISVVFWFVIPIASEMIICNSEYSLLWLLNLSIFHIYTIIFAGWSSYSKYANLGSLRTTAQLVSYEVLTSVLYGYLFNLTKDLNFLSYIENELKIGSFSYFLPALAVVFYISSLAEAGRHPFDLPEAEAELVAGYNVEYSSIWFALFFLGEYLNVVFNAILFNDLFFGQSCHIYLYTIRVIAIVFLTIFIRSLIPRYRYDQLMSLNWKVLLPIMSGFVLYLIYLENFVS